MKIYYDADLDKRSFEGRTTIARRLKSYLEGQGFEFTENVEEADMMHFHSSGIAKSYLASKLKKKHNIPCFYSLYSNSKTEPLNHIRNFLIQSQVLEKGATSGLLSYSAILPLKLRGYFLKKLDKVIVPSNYLKKQLFDNTKIIRFGVDTSKFVPLENNLDKKEDGNEKIKVAFFGHPGVFKGQTDFVQASKHFQDKIEPYMFFTKRSQKTDDYIVKNNPKIKIFGHVENIQKIYNEMDIIVLPYRNPLGAIANPLILLEAMSCERAVITTNLPFLREIVGDNALMVEPYNPKRIAKAVNWLAVRPEVRQKMGIAARERIIEHHNQEKMFKEFLCLYKEFESKIKDGR